MPVTSKFTLPPSLVAAECRAASHTLRAVSARLEAMAACLPRSAVDLRAAIEVATRDHLERTLEALEVGGDE